MFVYASLYTCKMRQNCVSFYAKDPHPFQDLSGNTSFWRPGGIDQRKPEVQCPMPGHHLPSFGRRTRLVLQFIHTHALATAFQVQRFFCLLDHVTCFDQWQKHKSDAILCLHPKAISVSGTFSEGSLSQTP